LNSRRRQCRPPNKQLGGKIKIIVNKGEGHYPVAPEDPQPVVDFAAENPKKS